MKKLIVLSVVFALVATAAFAVDLSASVFGRVTLIESDNSDDATINGSAGMERVRFDGYGEAAEGKFGGWIRFGGAFNAYAFWKPIDQLKLVIGGNPDGMYGKEGITGWMLNETPYDAGVAIGGNNVWGWGPGGGDCNLYGQAIKTRHVFYGGFGGDALHLNIKPLDMIGINLVLPYFAGGEVADVFGDITAQVDLNFDFGNIALTFEGNSAASGGKVYVYYGGNFDALGLDFGVSYGFDDSGDAQPIGIGLGVKYATDAFGIRFRAVTTLAGADEYFRVLAELVPYFVLGDNLAAFVNVGLSMSVPGEGDSVTDFHVNPYIRVGEEWGAQFLAGFKLWSEGGLSDGVIKWGVPIAIALSF